MTMRKADLEMTPEQFRKLGYQAVDQLATFLQELPSMDVTTTKEKVELAKELSHFSADSPSAPETIISETIGLMKNGSLYNSHSKFWGYITSSPAPIGIIGDLIASCFNQNVGANQLSPMATEIEQQAIRWIAEAINCPEHGQGIMVSGGNMANMIGFMAAKTNQANWNIRGEGLANHTQMVAYCAKGTHTWIQKSADLFGIGTDWVRWIQQDSEQRMRMDVLEQTIREDLESGYQPFMVVGTAGSVSTGVVDPLDKIADICKKYKLWFHVDGAYGGPAAMVSSVADQFKGMNRADSIALDPHKWLYSPLEVGCTLVKSGQALLDTFSANPEYYGFEEDPNKAVNFFAYGIQNSRGFRALKVWMGFRQVGISGFRQMIGDDIALAKELYELALKTDQIQPISQYLSITTFRYLPTKSMTEEEINKLNERIVSRMQYEGKAFVSNALVDGKYCLRACIVNFRTELSDLQFLIEETLRLGRILESE